MDVMAGGRTTKTKTVCYENCNNITLINIIHEKSLGSQGFFFFTIDQGSSIVVTSMIRAVEYAVKQFEPNDIYFTYAPRCCVGFDNLYPRYALWAHTHTHFFCVYRSSVNPVLGTRFFRRAWLCVVCALFDASLARGIEKTAVNILCLHRRSSWNCD